MIDRAKEATNSEKQRSRRETWRTHARAVDCISAISASCIDSNGVDRVVRRRRPAKAIFPGFADPVPTMMCKTAPHVATNAGVVFVVTADTLSLWRDSKSQEQVGINLRWRDCRNVCFHIVRTVW